ncbi:hypothetical protein PR048_010757 [Dryococelus australis]|uniref:Uncharacterized protein n=1 Tax=Dryococelus australis TaxID=614101 RepID=A0ABQ9I3L2_9NEOP|nr:hypothetical protein PR048_010757 [Dryococelus australis]
MWESCWTMPLAGGFSRGTPVPPALAFKRRSILASHFYVTSGDAGTSVPDGKPVFRAAKTSHPPARRWAGPKKDHSRPPMWISLRVPGCRRVVRSPLRSRMPCSLLSAQAIDAKTKQSTSAVAELLACSPPTEVIRVRSPAGPLDFSRRNRAGQCRWSARFLGGFPCPFIPVPLHNHLNRPAHEQPKPAANMSSPSVHDWGSVAH